MTCCLNPDCKQPQNPDDAEYCLSCGDKLTPSLRGRYRITRLLGQGGFGRTFLAVDDDRLAGRCVIKQFSPQVKGTKSLDKAIKLFKQEAERLNELGEHPQIPTLLAYFEHDERLYLVQQFIEGQTLLQELAQYGGFGERRVREILAGVLPVLKFVHDHHVIHRDITPSNIIRRFSDNKLVLIDFGVSKLLSTADTGVNAQPGTKIGTEGYAPMEQLRGGKAYPASDLYSLAATCIYLMTQTKPDDLYDPLEGRWIWRERLAQQGGTISEGIAQILDKMLKDLVSERYQSADAVMRDLRLALSRPVGSAPGTAAGAAAVPKTQTSRPLTAPSSSPSNPPSGGLPKSGPGQGAGAGQPIAPPSGGNRPVSAPRRSHPLSGQPISASSGSRCVLTLTGHSRWVTAVALSPDGKRVASGGLDDAIKIWNRETGELLLTLRGHTKPVNCLAISPDCQILVSGSDDHTLKVWNLTTGVLLQTLHGHSRDVNSVAIHPGGQLIASGAEDRTARVWRLGTGEPLRVFSNLAGMIRAVALSPDGQWLASGGLDNQVKLWSLKTGTLSSTFAKSHYSSVNAIAFSPNGNILISGSRDKTIKLWNIAKGEVLRTLIGHTDSVNAIALSSNGRLLVSGSSDTTLKIWNAETGEQKGTLADHMSSVNGVSISPDGRWIASASSDNTVKIWQLG